MPNLVTASKVGFASWWPTLDYLHMIGVSSQSRDKNMVMFTLFS